MLHSPLTRFLSPCCVCSLTRIDRYLVAPCSYVCPCFVCVILFLSLSHVSRVHRVSIVCLCAYVSPTPNSSLPRSLLEDEQQARPRITHTRPHGPHTHTSPPTFPPPHSILRTPGIFLHTYSHTYSTPTTCPSAFNAASCVPLRLLHDHDDALFQRPRMRACICTSPNTSPYSSTRRYLPPEPPSALPKLRTYHTATLYVHVAAGLDSWRTQLLHFSDPIRTYCHPSASSLGVRHCRCRWH
ncbi:hypothetical protein BKA62DRAFT_404939 [Auriculariales sp. MPI-PUGE-AT-0066]|nr:hypothetical protein BKA62DRAFT_404939 [Auriculariales sp. MPI-PUGE-AT-0066]